MRFADVHDRWLVANGLSHTHARPWWDVTFREVPIVAETYIYTLPAVGWGIYRKTTKGSSKDVHIKVLPETLRNHCHSAIGEYSSLGD